PRATSSARRAAARSASSRARRRPRGRRSRLSSGARLRGSRAGYDRPVGDYSIVNLREVEDQAAKFGFAEVQEARFPRQDLSAATIGLAFHRVKPRRRQAFAHRHENAEEICDIGPFDAIRIAPPVTRAFEADADGLELLAFGPRTEGDGEVVREGFWE